MTINDWLQDKNRDYNTGVNLYAASTAVKTRMLSGLRKGRSPRNLAVLIKELRQLRNKRERPSSPQPPKIKRDIVAPSIPVQNELEKKSLLHKSSESYFKKTRFGDLPAELRPRFRILKDLWYEMGESKFQLNDLPAKREKDALKLILHIEALDEEKDLIWKEIDHWRKYKTLLPTKSGEDFSKLSPQQLYLKKANLVSYINKKNKRIERWKEDFEKEPVKQERIKIQEQINRTIKDVHEHELDIKSIEGM